MLSIVQEINADVSASFSAAKEGELLLGEEKGPRFSVKFHLQPLYSVVEYELAHGSVVPPLNPVLLS